MQRLGMLSLVHLSLSVTVQPSPRSFVNAVTQGDLSLVSELISRGASLDATTDEDDEITPLHAAAWANRAAVAAILVAGGAHVDASTSHGMTPLHLAAAVGATDVVEVLLAANAMELQDMQGQTPLHAAASSGSADVCELLTDAGACVDSFDAFGFSPLRWAVLQGHTMAALCLLKAGADGSTPLCGLTPLALASACGHTETVAGLLHAGICDHSDGCVSAHELAREMGYEHVAQMLDEQSPIVIRGRPPAHPAPILVHEVDAEELARDRACWDEAFRTSTPLLVRNCGREWSVGALSAAELGERWGERQVSVSFSPDALYQRPWPSSEERRSEGSEGDISGARRRHGALELRETPTANMTFCEFVGLLPAHGEQEYFAVSQSRSASLDEFEGLPDMPPLLAPLIGSCNRRNLWVNLPPKLSALHHDSDDSVLIQLSGSKRFTLLSPEPLHGLTAYPSLLDVTELDRVSAGRFESNGRTGRTLSHFPLANVTHPDLARHPLLRMARKTTVEVPEGSALLLPAYWYHQVESFAPPGRLNVAINYWFNAEVGGGAPSHLHRTLREKLRVDLARRSRDDQTS